MTMEKLKLCVRWSACRKSPTNVSLAYFKQEGQTKLIYILISNGNSSDFNKTVSLHPDSFLILVISTFENSLDSGYPFASVPARCTKTTLLEMW